MRLRRRHHVHLLLIRTATGGAGRTRSDTYDAERRTALPVHPDGHIGWAPEGDGLGQALAERFGPAGPLPRTHHMPATVACQLTGRRSTGLTDSGASAGSDDTAGSGGASSSANTTAPRSRERSTEASTEESTTVGSR